MTQFKHNLTNEIISESEYKSLSLNDKRQYKRVDKSNDTIISAAIGYATDSAILGGIIGGSFEGGIIGDLLDGDLFD